MINPAFPIPLLFCFFPMIEQIRPGIESISENILKQGHTNRESIPKISPNIEVTGVFWAVL